MSEQDKNRIEIDAKIASYKCVREDLCNAFMAGYINGATVERINSSAEIKEARNKAIDEIRFKINDRVSELVLQTGLYAGVRIDELQSLDRDIKSMKQ